jgi:hypothetical protein
MTSSYLAYGLGIGSTIPLPELMEGSLPAGVEIRYGKVERPPRLVDGYDAFCYATPEEVYLSWEGEGAYLVRGGKEIIVDLVPGAEAETVRLTLLGPALAVLLHQLGLIVLHASGVVVNGEAAIFLGDSGWGKSTLAAALYGRGYGIIADDLVAVNNAGTEAVVFPGFPQLKLWPEVLRFLGEAPELLPKAWADEEKRVFRAERRFPRQPLPLRGIYVLSQGPALGIEPLRPSDALIELVRHSCHINLMHPVKGPSYFLQCGGLVNRIPVRRLITPRSRSLETLPSMIRMLEEDLGLHQDQGWPETGDQPAMGVGPLDCRDYGVAPKASMHL